jgi:hypothetical protein
VIVDVSRIGWLFIPDLLAIAGYANSVRGAEARLTRDLVTWNVRRCIEKLEVTSIPSGLQQGLVDESVHAFISARRRGAVRTASMIALSGIASLMGDTAMKVLGFLMIVLWLVLFAFTSASPTHLGIDLRRLKSEKTKLNALFFLYVGFDVLAKIVVCILKE